MFIDKKTLVDLNLDPNEYFVLYNIFISMNGDKDNDNTKINKVFTLFELMDIQKKLEEKGLIKRVSKDEVILREAGIQIFVDEDPSLFSFIAKYRKLFSDTSIAGVQGDRKGCLSKMKRFFKEYPEFDCDTILKATEFYIEKERMNNNYRFLQKAHYFIFKQDNHKNEVSNLAAFCESVLQNNAETETPNITRDA